MGDPLEPTVSTAAECILPVEVLVKNTTLKVNTAPGVGGGIAYRYKGLIPSNSGELDILDTNTSVTTDVELTMPSVAEGFNYFTVWFPAGGTAASQGLWCTEYVNPLDERQSFYHAGSISGGGLGFGASNTFGRFHWSNISTGQAEADYQAPWPVTGKFNAWVLLWKNLTAGTMVELAFRVNGVDTKVFTISGAGSTAQHQLDLTTLAPVTAGDLVGWRLKRVSGSATGCNAAVCIGFGA